MNVKKWGAVMLLAGLCLGGTTVQANQVDQAHQLMLIKQMEKWYRAPIEEVLQAAEQGDTMSQKVLASRYNEGIGVTQDYKLAYVWCSVAAANEHTEPLTSCVEFANQLTPAILVDAQTLAGQYVEKYQRKE